MIDIGILPMEMRDLEKLGSRGDVGRRVRGLEGRQAGWSPPSLPPAWLGSPPCTVVSPAGAATPGSRLNSYGGGGTHLDMGEVGTKTLVSSWGLMPVSGFILEFIASWTVPRHKSQLEWSCCTLRSTRKRIFASLIALSVLDDAGFITGANEC